MIDESYRAAPHVPTAWHVDGGPSLRPERSTIDDLEDSLFELFCAHYSYVSDIVRLEMAGDAAKHVLANYNCTPRQ